MSDDRAVIDTTGRDDGSLERTTEVLQVAGVAAGYGRIQIVQDVNISVPSARLVAMIGLNGAGKSTVLKAVLGFSRLFAGRITIAGEDVTQLRPHERVARGLGYVPQGRQVFPDLTVVENLRMGGFLLRNGAAESVQEMFELFPRLRERARVVAGALSGGEQQMLAMARALMGKPVVLILDEPTLGLAPALVEQVMEQVLSMRHSGYSILMVEQNATLALKISDYAYIIDGGTSSERHDPALLMDSDEVARKYLGAR
ncbi:MAG: ABC transporter ATP-binding protein [Acidimicrobiaceae bacterium]|nr:ABC transporter ATP-binding protein [Acidimicrobiaceae bacterium]